MTTTLPTNQPTDQHTDVPRALQRTLDRIADALTRWAREIRSPMRRCGPTIPTSRSSGRGVRSSGVTTR